MTIDELKARLVELQETGKAIQAKADAEKRDLNPDEQNELDKIFAEFDSIEGDIKRRDRIAAQEARLSESQGRIVPPMPVQPQNRAPQASDDSHVVVGMRNTSLSTVEQRQRWGFRDFGEFCVSVKNAALQPGKADQRLIQNALTTYGSEGVAADGGFAVPPEWRSQIMQAVAGEESLLARTDQQQASGNTITFPVDETTAWQTSGGIQAYWDGEASAATQSKPNLKDVTLKLHKLLALVPVTDELLEDAPAMGSYVARKAAEKIAFKITDAIINGTGAGQPLGILNAPCKVQVGKISNQVAATFHAKNAAMMMGRMPASSFARSVWLVNQDVVQQILQLGFAVTDGTTSNVGAGALYLPPNGLMNGSPYGSLLGRPIVVTEACQALGTAGDVILADMSQYLSVVKSSGVRSDTSIHLYFDQAVTAFRFMFRMAGQPWLSAAIARKNGSSTLSHFITLEGR